ncbi:MAG: SHD1 domain-containing protein [Pirellulaceae bacterium]
MGRGLKIQITLLNEGGINLYINGQEIEKNQSGTTSNAVSSMKWIINGGELEFREPNGTVAFYRIQDKDTFVGPIAKKTAAERQRKVTGANEQQVFTRGAAPASAFREFSDSTGQFKIRAKFIEFRMGKVHLQKDDGKLLTLSMDKLSRPDQQYILTEIKNRK